MVFLRSLAFNTFFYLHTIFWLFALLPTEVLPKRAFWWGVNHWARINRWALTAIGGVKVEIRGLENLPKGGALIAAKHHSTFETVSLLDLLVWPSYVMKRELRKIPLFGWYTIKGEQISVDRRAGRAALTDMTERAKIAAEVEPEQYTEFLASAENPEFAAHIVDAIDQAPNREELSGQTLISAEIARELGITDRGAERPSYRAMLGNPRDKNPAAVY